VRSIESITELKPIIRFVMQCASFESCAARGRAALDPMGLCVARSMFVIDRPRRGERDIVISRASDRRARKTDRCDHLRYC